MRGYRSALALLAGFVCIFEPGDAKPAAEVSRAGAEVSSWVDRLGSRNFHEREEATRVLESIGPPALDRLRRASRSGDQEIRQRAAGLLVKITRRMETERVLTPTRVHLFWRDLPLSQAVSDLAKQSGYRVILGVDQMGGLARRRISLDTGETSFWQALDRVCQEGGLVETRPEPGLRGAPGGRPLPASGVNDGRRSPPFPSSQILLSAGTTAVLPTCYAGALRIRALSLATTASATAADEIGVRLEIAAEPRLQLRGWVDVRIENALDDRGQRLSQVPLDPRQSRMPDGLQVRTRRAAGGWSAAGPSYRRVTVVFRPAGMPSHGLREVSGFLGTMVQAPPETLASVEHVLQAAGHGVSIPEVVTLKVIEVSRDEHQLVKLRVQVQTAPGVVPANTLAVAPRSATTAGGLILVDGKGQPFNLAELSASGTMVGNLLTREFRLSFRPQPGQGEPARLQFVGSRLTAVEVRFVLRDIPMP